MVAWVRLSTALGSWWAVLVPLGLGLVLALCSRLVGRRGKYAYSAAWLVGLTALCGVVGSDPGDWLVRGAVVLAGWSVLSLVGLGLVFEGLAVAPAVGFVSVGAGLVVWHFGWLGSVGLDFVANLCAVLCVGWMAGADIVARLGREWLGRAVWPSLDVLKVAGLTCGLGAVLMRVLDAAMLLSARLFSPYDWLSRIPAPGAGLFDLLAVMAAVGLWRVCNRSRLQAISVFWLLVVTVVWSGLMIPPDLEVAASWWPAWMPWTLWIQVGLSAAVVVFVVAEGLMAERRWLRAWPDRLSVLARPVPGVAGLREAAGMVGVVVLVLGVIHVLGLPRHYRVAAIATFLCAAGVSVCMFRLAEADWNVNLAEVGIGTATLAGAVLAIVVWPVDTSRELAPQIPVLLNTVLFGLIFMTWLWHWLARFWRQQLLDGRAWTTAGRLVPVVLRVGFMTGALALMLSLLMGLWPEMGLYVSTRDASVGRWIWGVLANVALILVLAWCARSAGKVTLAWSAVLAVVVFAHFVAIRLPGGVVKNWWSQHWPLLWTCAGVGFWLLGQMARRGSWSILVSPLGCLALALPAVGVVGVVLSPSWSWAVVLISIVLIALMVLQWLRGRLGGLLGSA